MNKEQSDGAGLPVISIVTVVLNDREGLRKTLDSVEKQTYPFIQPIVIDGGSSDGTLDVIHDREDSIGYWISEPDSGIYDAMNKGVRHAKGELIMFLNAADVLPSADTLGDFVAADYRAPEQGPNLYVCSVRTDKGALKKPKMLWLKQHYMLPCYHQGMLYPAGILRSEPFSERYRISSDVHHFLRIRDQIRIVVCDTVLAVYDTNGISSVNIDARDEEYHRIYRELGVSVVFRWLKKLHELHQRLRKH